MSEEGVLSKLAQLEDRLDEVREIVRAIQLNDAEARGDMKVVVGKLDNASTALANAAQSIQRATLQTAEGEDGRLPRWAVQAGFALIVIIAALVGVKEVLPAILKMLAGL